MEKPKGLIFLPEKGGLPGLTPIQTGRLRREADGFDWVVCRDSAEFVDVLPEATAALVWYFKRDWQARAGKLRLLSTPSAGKELVHAVPSANLEVAFSSFHGELIAETVVGMMLAFLRGIKDCLDRGDAAWPRTEVVAGMRHLRGSRAVIVGFGHIGKWIGRTLKAFGVAVTGVNRTDMARPEYFAAGDAVVPLSELDAALPGADHVVMVLPGGDGSNNVMDARRLALLSPHAYIYNVGRGNSIELPALVEALKAGRLAGAGLDVFPIEPLPGDSPVIGCPRVIRLPHVSAFGPGYMDSYINELVEKLRTFRGVD